MRLTEVLEHLTQAVATVEAEGEKLRVRALLDERPLSEETLSVCRAHKQELLAYVAFAAQADALLLASSRRLTASWPPGCTLETDPCWSRVESDLHQAYWMLDIGGVQQAIRAREQLALKIFANFKGEQTERQDQPWERA